MTRCLHSKNGIQHLYSTMCKHIASEGLCTYIQPCSKTQQWKGFTLTSDDVRKHRIGRDLHLHLTMFKNTASKGISVPDWGFLVIDQVPPFRESHSTLIFYHVGTNPTITSEWLSTHIWHGRNKILSPWQNGLVLTSDHGRNLILSPC